MSTTTAMSPTLTAEPGPIERVWGRCFAALYGPLLWRTERRGNAARRAHLLRHAAGTVVEIGAGSGHNLSIRRAGFEIEELVADELEFDIPLIRPLIWGTARNAGER